jgi:Domain of unknown function (DUF4149)
MVSMAFFLRALRLLTIVVWVGGLGFFAFVLAPVAFGVLPSTHEAGLVVRGTLTVLNGIGQLCGGLFALTTVILWSRARIQARTLLLTQLLFVVLMMVATAYVQVSAVPAMERDRIAAGGIIDAVPPGDPNRMDFERLHVRSEWAEGTVLALGFLVVMLMGWVIQPERAIAES